MWLFAIPLVGVVLVLVGALTLEIWGGFTAPFTVADIGFIVLASGVGACALIEILKRVFKVRARYHRHATRDWLRIFATDKGDPSDWNPAGDRSPRHNAEGAFREFEEVVGLRNLASGASARQARWAFYDAPLEQLAAQIASGFERAILEWFRFPSLVERLAPGFADFAAPLEVDRLSRLYKEIDERHYFNSQADERDAGLFDRAARIASDQAQQQVDLFQIVTGSQWRRSISVWALFLAGLLGATLAALLLGGGILASALTATILGGFLAWVVRDTSAAIERWRGGA